MVIHHDLRNKSYSTSAHSAQESLSLAVGSTPFDIATWIMSWSIFIIMQLFRLRCYGGRHQYVQKKSIAPASGRCYISLSGIYIYSKERAILKSNWIEESKWWNDITVDIQAIFGKWSQDRIVHWQALSRPIQMSRKLYVFSSEAHRCSFCSRQ